FLAPDEIPRALFTEGSEIITEVTKILAPKIDSDTNERIANLDVENAMAELADYSLVELEAEAFSCHRLLQAISLDRLNLDERKQWGQIALKLLNTYTPKKPSDVRTWPIWNRLQPHVGILLKNIGDDSNDAAAVLMSLFANFLKGKALYSEAEPLNRRALAIGEKNLGPEHPKVALRLNNLASLLLDTERLAEAEPLFRRSLAIDEKNNGPEHPEVSRELNNLASLFQVTNRRSEAEPLYRRALAIDEKYYGSEHPEVAIDLGNLAMLFLITNRLSEAEPISRRAAVIFVHSLGMEHPNTKVALEFYKKTLAAMKLSKLEIQAKLRVVMGQ
ncbi:MAG TPA: tetratricopeptide repeat protein, partial [Verrucomicrobiae bacterium]